MHPMTSVMNLLANGAKSETMNVRLGFGGVAFKSGAWRR